MKTSFGASRNRVLLTSALLALNTHSALAQDVVVTIGVAGPLTGQLASHGHDMERSGRMAIESLNAKGIEVGGQHIRFEMIAADDGADPKTGTLIAQQLADTHVTAVVGHINSGVAIPASHIYHDAHIPLISSGASNPLLTAQGQTSTFRDVADDNAQARGMVQLVSKTLKVKSIGVVDDRTAYGQGLGDEVAKDATGLGIKVTREYTTDKAVDFRAILTTLKAADPDAIILASTNAVAAPFVQQMKTLGMAKVHFVGGDGICTENWVHVAAMAAEGEYCTQTGATLDQMPGTKQFVDRYLSQFHEPPQYFGPYTYDAVMLIGAAIKKADSVDPNKITAALHAISYEGVTGHIEFDSKGDRKNAAVSVYQVQQQKIVPLGVAGVL